MSTPQGYHPAEVQVVFHSQQSLCHPDQDGKIYTLINWYSKIWKRPNKLTKMYEVSQELDMHGQWKSGVVRLSQVKGICLLAPSIKGDCPSSIMMDNCFDIVSDYHINHYSLLSLFRHLWGTQL